MKYLNLGCGSSFLTMSEWTNLDFTSSGESVIAHNLLNGIPYSDNYFDLVYHSHVLEHFSKDDGEAFIAECFRVLKPGGVVRIAIPDLEQIVRQYLKYLDKGLEEPENKDFRANYEWMLIEMYDQTVRNHSGGNMAKYLYQDNIINESFLYHRIGKEGRDLRENFLSQKKVMSNIRNNKSVLIEIISEVKQRIKGIVKSQSETQNAEIGKFRRSGEIHQWMYDRYSLSFLLQNNGGKDIIVRDAFTSYIKGWTEFGLDANNNVVRKPDSLYIEAIKS